MIVQISSAVVPVRGYRYDVPILVLTALDDQGFIWQKRGDGDWEPVEGPEEGS